MVTLQPKDNYARNKIQKLQYSVGDRIDKELSLDKLEAYRNNISLVETDENQASLYSFVKGLILHNDHSENETSQNLKINVLNNKYDLTEKKIGTVEDADTTDEIDWEVDDDYNITTVGTSLWGSLNQSKSDITESFFS